MSASLCLLLSKAGHPRLACAWLIGCPKSKQAVQSELCSPCTTSPSAMLQSDGTRFLAGLHCSDSGLEHQPCSWARISCPHQNSRGEHSSLRVSARDIKPQREAEQHISSVCELKMWGLFPNAGKSSCTNPRAEPSSHQAGHQQQALSLGTCISQILLSLEFHWQPLCTENSDHPSLL